MTSKVNIVSLCRRNSPAYANIDSVDGQPLRCVFCKENGHPSRMYYVAKYDLLKSGPYHKFCIDEEWLRLATKIPGLVEI